MKLSPLLAGLFALFVVAGLARAQTPADVYKDPAAPAENAWKTCSRG